MEIGSVRNYTQIYGNGVVPASNVTSSIRQNETEIEPKVAPISEDDDSEVIGMSADGDTARASREAVEDLKDGMVFAKQTSSDEPAESNNVSTLTGFSKNELERLKVTGEISQNAYDREIERREQLLGSDESDDTVTGLENESQVVSNAGTGETVESQSHNEDEASQIEKSSEARKEIISEEIEESEEFAKRMSKLSSEGENIQLQLEGLTQAFASGRGEMATQIFQEGLLKGITQI